MWIAANGNRMSEEEPMADTQTHATHRRYYPLYHFVVLPLALINVVVRVVYAFRHRHHGW